MSELVQGEIEVLAEIARLVGDAHPPEKWPALTRGPELERSLAKLLESHWEKSPDDLAELAGELDIGGAHTGGYLIDLVRRHVMLACPRLVAATIYRTWKGGKAGFQFLPDPATMELEEYEAEVCDLTECIATGINNPLDVLTDRDRDFYNALPDRFTAYRGCRGVTPEQAAAGVCWTTRRDIAEWFAEHGGGAPVLASARVRKDNVMLAYASEFEVVVTPSKFRALKHQPRNRWRPQMAWGEVEKYQNQKHGRYRRGKPLVSIA